MNITHTVLLSIILAGVAFADLPETRQTEEPEITAAAVLRLAVELTDGSRVIGTPATEAIPLQAVFGAIEVPWTQLTSATFDKDNESITVLLTNGDRVSGAHALDELRLTTLFGDIEIDASHIRKILFFGTPAGPYREGLILWNRLGSEAEVEHGIVGPGGTMTAGRFVEGRFGKGLELKMDESFGVTFPPEILPAPDGCIEFWAKLVNFPANIPPGDSPGLIAASNDAGHRPFLLHLNGNDGAGNGGLCARVSGLGSAGTGTYGSWTYARALNTNRVGDWHHYALVWASGGIPGIGDGSRTTAVFLNGTLNSASWTGRFGGNEARIPMSGKFGLLVPQTMTSGSVVFDNLKIWNYPKTDFSERFEE